MTILVTVDGRRDQLSGKLQERYGIAKETAETQIADWEKKRLIFGSKKNLK